MRNIKIRDKWHAGEVFIEISRVSTPAGSYVVVTNEGMYILKDDGHLEPVKIIDND